MRSHEIKKIFPLFLFLFVASVLNLSAQGHFELSFHYSQWSIDILRSVIEDGLSDALDNELKDEFLDEIREEHPGLVELSYDQVVRFDSGGNNYGLEIRWYPGGLDGSFSLGLSVEKTTMKVSLPEVSAEMVLNDPVSGATGNFGGSISNAQFILKPLSFHLHFRWDIKPSWRIHPYFTFGFGAASSAALEKAEFSASWTGNLDIEGEPSEHYEGSEKKTLEELRLELEAEGEDFFLPGFVPFIQLNFGLKGEITENLHLLVDVGIWDGFLLRGGIAIRL